MTYEKFIQPRDIDIGDRVFAVSKIPAIEAIPIFNSVCKSVSENGTLGIAMLPPATVKLILGYTALRDADGICVVLGTDRIVNETFADDFGDLQQLVVAMVRENFDFFVDGRLLDLLVQQEQATASGS